MKPTFRQKFKYWFDNQMSRGTPAMIGMLFVLSLAVVLVAGAIISIAGFVQEGQTERIPFIEAAWESLMRTLDSGTMGGDQRQQLDAEILQRNHQREREQHHAYHALEQLADRRLEFEPDQALAEYPDHPAGDEPARHQHQRSG